MRRPPTHPVGWRRRVVVGVDREGNDKHEWAEPETVLVHALWAPNSIERDHDRVVSDLEMLVPREFSCSPFDKFVVDGATYSVIGRTADWNTGPFAYQPGNQISLKIAEG